MMDLPSKGGDGTALTHWEKRLFQNEAMTGTVHTKDPHYSRLTFALLEDSGWYLPNYELVRRCFSATRTENSNVCDGTLETSTCVKRLQTFSLDFGTACLIVFFSFSIWKPGCALNLNTKHQPQEILCQELKAVAHELVLSKLQNNAAFCHVQCRSMFSDLKEKRF